MIQNKIIHIHSLIKVLLVLFFLTMFISPVLAWADATRNRSAFIYVNNTGNSTSFTNISVNLNVTYDSDMNQNGSDLLIYNETSGVVIPHWINYIDSINGSYFNLWFNATLVSASSWNNNTFRLYYNNSAAQYNNTEGGNDTFPFFCDFSFDNCTLTRDFGSTDTPIISNGLLSFAGGNSNQDGFSWASSTQNTPIVYEIDARRTSGGLPVIWRPDSASFFRYLRWNAGSVTWLNDAGGSDFTVAQVMDVNSWYKYRIDFITQDNVNVFVNGSQIVTGGNPSDTFTSVQAGIAADNNVNVDFDNVRFRKFVLPDITSQLGNESNIDGLSLSKYNNHTNNGTTNFSVLSGRYINYSIISFGSEIPDSIIWRNNGTNQTSCTLVYCVIQVQNSNINNITFNASNLTSGNYTLDGWNVTAINYVMELQQPANTTTGVTIPVTLYWRQWQTVVPHTWQIATDTQFIGVVASGSATSTTENFSSGAVALNNATKYYWRVRNATGSYSSFFEFTTSIATAVPGQINATVFDEQNYTRITNFTAQLYNSTTMVTKSTTTGWANFSSAEVSSGIYLLRIVPNSSYASRNVLVTSPNNATVYLPSTTNTINTIAFYLLDYTTRYPWSSSILSITKNNSVMHSSYFDADAKVAAYLIQGDSYGITITNSNNIHNWGNYIAIASGNVEIVLTDIAVNATSAIPFRYNLSKSNTDITLSWRSNHTLNNLNFTILKNNSILVHQLITTIPVGQSQYIVTDLNSVYYIYLTVEGSYYEQLNIFDPRVGVLRTDCGLGLGCIIGWGSGSTRYSLPQWMYNSSTVLIIWIIAGSFGAVFASFGVLLGLIMSLLFAYWGWFSITQIGLAFLGTVTIIAIVDYLRNKE